MQLLTKEIIKLLPPLYSTEGNGEAPVIVKFFFPGPGTWYITEGRQEENGDWLFFGLCDLGEPELGYVRLSDLKSVKVNGLGIERDLHFNGYVLDYGTHEVRHASGDVEHPPKACPAGDPEAELRAMWTAKGVPEERQNEILTDVAAKAQPGARVGPFRISEKSIPAGAAAATEAETAARNAHENGNCDAHCQLCYAEVFAEMPVKMIQ